MHHGSRADDSASSHPIAHLIDQLAHLLPAQGPISIFIHHNTLHALEHLRFEEAVETAADRLGREPFLAESRYRDKLASGRILATDVQALIQEQLGARGGHDVAGFGSRLDLWRAIVLHGIPAATGRELRGFLKKRRRFPDFALMSPLRPAPPDRTSASSTIAPAKNGERCVACGMRASAASVAPAREFRPSRRFHFVIATGCRPSRPSTPTRGFIHRSSASWPAISTRASRTGRCRKSVSASTAAFWKSTTRGWQPNAASGHTCYRAWWARIALPAAARSNRSPTRSPSSVCADDERHDYLGAELLALRGWAGIVRQIEERPDRVPARDVIVTLRGYLAVRLLFERAALAHAAQRVAFGGSLSDLRQWLRHRLPQQPTPTTEERAWPLFHVAQLCGLDASVVEQWTASHVVALEAELSELDGLRRRRILHQAFERTIRHRLYDALMRHAPRPLAKSPAFQAVFCIDEREESFRRHLEEVEPSCETFSTAGFFNVAMYHQGMTDAHPRPLCPVAIRPEHYVAEIEPDTNRFTRHTRRLQRRAAGFLGYNVHLGSRLPVRGAVLMTAFGWLALVPLILRVVFPWLSSRWTRVRETTTTASRTRLLLDRDDGVPPIGVHSGFTVREMADIVRRVVDDLGIRDRLSPLVLVIGHGSISLNNPHESAHDCGACGGGRGGPNARAFAHMANDPRVRQLLASEGLVIDRSTWFLGAQRNTCNNDVTFFDEDLVPAPCQATLSRAKDAIDATRRREAHERCRRFDAVPRWFPPLAALAHVEGRAADLAQPRPEYGHATNAFCIVGRRTRTRGLFLDRRAFLVSSIRRATAMARSSRASWPPWYPSWRVSASSTTSATSTRPGMAAGRSSRTTSRRCSA